MLHASFLALLVASVRSTAFDRRLAGGRSKRVTTGAAASNGTRCFEPARCTSVEMGPGVQHPPWQVDDKTRLVVGVRLSADNGFDARQLGRCLCSITKHHPRALVLVLGVVRGELRALVRNQIRQHAQASLSLCRDRPSAFDALASTAKAAEHHGATHFAYMQHQMLLLLPFPVQSLTCNFMPFQVRVAALRPKVNAALTRLVSDLGTIVLASDSASGVSSSPDAWSRSVGSGDNATEVELIPSQSFICDEYALRKLIRAVMQLHSSCDSRDDEDGEQVLAAVARHLLRSPPLRCSLDGCASSNEPADGPACHRARVLLRAAPAALDVTVDGEQGAEDACDVLGGSSGTTLAPPAQTLRTPLFRHVAPPMRIAREVLAGLAPGRNGSALFGAEAMARLAAEPRWARRVLIYVHSHSATHFDTLHRRMLQIPRTRHLPIVHGAAILLGCNNPGQPTARLLERLRGYAQRTRWLIHSPLNPGGRHESKPGYLCGEFGTLVASTPIWSRYRWVLYSNPDVYVSPELFQRLGARLSLGENTTETDSGEPPADAYLDRFPVLKQRGRKVGRRYAMEYVVFRSSRALLVHPGSHDARMRTHMTQLLASTDKPPQADSIFADGLDQCLTQPRSVPEEVLAQMASRHHLRVRTLGAIHYLTFGSTFNYWVRAGALTAYAKTHLFPGAVWHNQNHTQVEEVINGEEAMRWSKTPQMPSEQELTKPPYTSQSLLGFHKRILEAPDTCSNAGVGSMTPCPNASSPSRGRVRDT